MNARTFEEDLVATALAPARFPRAAVLLETLSLAERCRCAAASLEAVCEGDFEPGTLRRKAHGIVRGLVVELSQGVVL